MAGVVEKIAKLGEIVRAAEGNAELGEQRFEQFLGGLLTVEADGRVADSIQFEHFVEQRFVFAALRKKSSACSCCLIEHSAVARRLEIDVAGRVRPVGEFFRTHDQYIDRDAQRTERAAQSGHLGGLIGDFALDHEQVGVAVRTRCGAASSTIRSTACRSLSAVTVQRSLVVASAGMAGGELAQIYYFFFAVARFSSIAACAAARRATGTR